MSSSSLVLSLRELPAAIGSFREEHLDWKVPEGWGTEVLSIPPGTVIPLDISLTSVEDGVLAQVYAQGELVGECVRCLDPLVHPWRIDASEVYFEPGAEVLQTEDPDVEVEGDELDSVARIDRDSIDLEPLLRDAILAGAPLQPVCAEDCQGFCDQCGVRLKDAEPGHQHETFDPRFAALEGFFEDGAK